MLPAIQEGQPLFSARSHLTLKGAMSPDIVHEEAGHKDEEDKSQPRPGRPTGFHLEQQALKGKDTTMGEAQWPRQPRGAFEAGTLPCRLLGKQPHPQHGSNLSWPAHHL